MPCRTDPAAVDRQASRGAWLSGTREPARGAGGTLSFETGPPADARPPQHPIPRIADDAIHRIFAASLQLHAALTLLDTDRTATPIRRAIAELDVAIAAIRAGAARQAGLSPPPAAGVDRPTRLDPQA